MDIIFKKSVRLVFKKKKKNHYGTKLGGEMQLFGLLIIAIPSTQISSILYADDA